MTPGLPDDDRSERRALTPPPLPQGGRSEDDPPSAEAEPEVAIPVWDMGPGPYQVICLASLMVIFLAELQRGVHVGSLLVPLVGLLAVVSRWAMAPLLLLVILAGAEGIRAMSGLRIRPIQQGLRVEDVLLCLGVLAYVASHYRLQGLLLHVLPPDSRRLSPEPGWFGRRRPLLRRRSAHLASRTEVGLFVLSLPVWALVAQVVWLVIGQPWTWLGWSARVNRLLLFTWVVGLGMFVTAALLALWKRHQHSAREATLFLQDTLWRETRGEQRRITRWLAWGRLKRRGENP